VSLFCAAFYGRALKLHQSDSTDDKVLLRSVIENNSNLSANEPRESDQHLQSVTLRNSHAVDELLMQFAGRKSETSTKVLQRQHVCPYCKKNFRVLAQLSIHLRLSHAGGRPLTCPTCNVSFVSAAHFDQHKRVHPVNNANQPQESHKQLGEFGSNTSVTVCRPQLTNHKTAIKQKTTSVLYSRYRCSYCERTFLTPGHLRLHMHCHRRRLFICKTCDRSFLSKFYLERHMAVHRSSSASSTSQSRESNNQEFSSDASAARCESDENLMHCPRGHKNETSPNVPSHRHGCTHCGKSFVKLGNLRIHLMQHDPNWRPFTCKACRMLFLTKGHRDRHVCAFSANNTNQPRESSKPKDSYEQSEGFSNGASTAECETETPESDGSRIPCTALGHLKRHERFYKRCRPFTCTACNRSFATQLHLDRQTCVHRIQGPFPCEICGKQFTQKRHLNAHALSHVYEPTKTRDVCSQIEQSSSSNDLLKSDVTESHTCDVCKREFEDERVFDTHMRLHSRLQTLYQRK